MTSDTPRVAHLVISLAFGGLERLVVDWTNARNRLRPGSTLVWCLDTPGDLAGQVEGDAVRCLHARRSRFPWDRDAVRRLAAELAGPGGGQPAAEVVHSHNLAAQQYAVLAARGTGIRHVHTQHGANTESMRYRDRWRSRLLARYTDALVAVSEATPCAGTRALRGTSSVLSRTVFGRRF
jgi:hypothetical protein